MHKGLLRLKLFLLFFGLLAPVFIFPVSKVSAYSTVLKNLPSGRAAEWIENGYLFYNPQDSEDSNPDCEYGTIDSEGTNAIDIIWNWLNAHGLSGNPEAIAGVLGNISVETGGTFNPFIQNGSGPYGLFQESGTRKTEVLNYLSSKGINPYTSVHSASETQAAIIAELEYAFIKSSSRGFLSHLNTPTIKSGVNGAQSYAELFLVLYERAIETEKYPGQPLSDPGVKTLTSYSRYQGASARRTAAASIFQQFAAGGSVSNPNPSAECTDGDSDGDGDGDGDSDPPQLQPGGMTLEQAQALMAAYNALSSDQYAQYGITSSDCKGGWKSNCVSFSKYFVNAYGGFSSVISKLGNGKEVANTLINQYGYSYSSTPVPYAVFSMNKGTTICNKTTGELCGHTGVVLGITDSNQVIVGEASCASTGSGGYIRTYSPSYFTKNNAIFAYKEVNI